MKTHPIRHPNAPLGTVWFVVPMLWAAVGLVGFALVSNWPELFAEEPPAASDTATASVSAGPDRAVPQGGGAPSAGASTAREATPPVDQF